MIGTRIGSWLITEEIGDGGHAFVFKGIKGDNAAAIKMLKPSVASQDNLEKRFKIEAETLKTLDHPGIVGFKEYLHVNRYHYMVLELMDQGSVEDILKNVGPIEPRYAIPMLFQVLDGMTYAHSFGYIHRDIKPNNILINREGQAKLTDFGIAKVIGGEALTKQGYVLGTSLYMAPEYLSQGVVSPQTDIYALGVTLYEMVTNRKPFEFEREDEPLVSFAKRVCLGSPTPPSSYRPIPDALERIILKAIARDPKKRYKSVDRMENDLKRAFPDLVQRPIEIPEGKPQTALLQMPDVGGQAGAETLGKPASPLERAIPWLAALGVAAIAAAAGFTLGSPIVGAALGALVLAVGIFFAIKVDKRRQEASPDRQALANAVRETGSEEPSSAGIAPKQDDDSDSIPFHSGSQDGVAQETDISELSAFLVVTEGESKDKRYGLRPVSRIGRDLRFDVRPRDPEISRQHAVLYFDGSGFTVKDLGSRNGTFVNEEKIEGEREIKNGDIVRVGRTSMRFECDF